MALKAFNLLFLLYSQQYHFSFYEFSSWPLCARLKISHLNHQSFRLEVELQKGLVDYWLDGKSFDSRN
jgi:hypothetical protein